MAKTSGFNVSNLYLEIDGKAAGVLSSFQAPPYEAEDITGGLGPEGLPQKSLGKPKIGEARATFPMSQGGPLFDVIAGVFRKDAVEFNGAVILADHDFKIQTRIEMGGCLITEVTFPKLDASDKSQFLATVTFRPESITYSKGSGKVTATVAMKARNWLTSNFKVTVPGLDSAFVTKVDLPAFTSKVSTEAFGSFRIPGRHYEALEISGLKTQHGSQGFDAAQALAAKVIKDGALTDSEYLDIAVDLFDPTLKHVLATFTAKRCAPKKFSWASEITSGQDGAPVALLEYTVENLTIERQDLVASPVTAARARAKPKRARTQRVAARRR